MWLIHRERIQEFIGFHSDSASSLVAWARNMETNIFTNPVAIKKTFGSADYVKPYWVFNISGNKYRLIALIDFALKTVSVEFVLVHAEYDENKWRKK